MKKSGMILILLMVTGSLFAQQQVDKEEPTAAEAAEVVVSIESDDEFIELFNWMMETPVNKEEEKRKQVIATLSNYIEIHPELKIELDPNVANFADDNPDMLLIFMAGWAKHSIENGNYDKLEGNLAGINSVIAYYESNEKFLADDRKIEKYQKLKEKGKLERKIEKKVY